MTGNIDLVMIKRQLNLLIILSDPFHKGITNDNINPHLLLFSTNSGISSQQVKGIHLIHFIFEFTANLFQIILLLIQLSIDPIDNDLYAILPPLVKQLHNNSLFVVTDDLPNLLLFIDLDVLGQYLSFFVHLQECFKGSIVFFDLLGYLV